MERVTAETISTHNLTPEEFNHLKELLGREPNLVELGVFSVMWSEHCSYKSSRVHLKRLPTTGERVIVPPGENAGVVDVGDGWCAAFKVESHNHPSFIEPFQGAATGVGGILRDIFTMGARPVAAMNSLRFGSLSQPVHGRRNRALLAGVVAGIAHYGNAFGVPTVGGEVVFDEAYSLNPLVNAFALGLVRHDQIFFGKAEGAGNPVLYVGPQREEGMTPYEIMLSESQERMLIVAHSGRERQVIDIFRKWDLDAVVIGRVTDTGRVVVVHEGRRVAEIPSSYLTDEAPRYERPMRAPEAREGRWQKAEGSQLSAAEGDPTITGEPGASVGGGPDIISPAPPTAPALDEAARGSSSHDFGGAVSLDFNDALARLLSAPNVASKEWVFQQYDHMVRTNTAVLPGADAAVVRIKETRRALAMCLDGNGRYCAIDPRGGARLVVAEAARNVVCVGARPLAITNCLNFASPERAEVMWAFSEVVDGMAEACAALGTPVVSGNVSFYNETEGRGIHPTPVIGMVGLIEDVRRVVTQGFKREGHLIALVGETAEDLAASEYEATVQGRTFEEMRGAGARLPRLDLARERAVQEAVLRAAEEGLLQSAHDCADGGLAVALAESCFSSLGRERVGASVELAGELSAAAQLFGETPSRVVVSFEESQRTRVERIAAQVGAPLRVVGRVGGARLQIKIGGEELIARGVAELERLWRAALGKKLQVEVLAAAAE